MDSIRSLPVDQARALPVTRGAQAPENGPADEMIRASRDDLRLLPPPLFPREAPAATASVCAASTGDGLSLRGFPRGLTPAERADWSQTFPAMDLERAVVTAAATWQYNCISWTVGETRAWFWPPEMYSLDPEEVAFDRFYASYGLFPSPQGEVARWRNEDGITHGCVSGPEHGPRWESKCGADLRVQHDLRDLEGSTYGRVDGYYARQEAPPTMAPFGYPPISDVMKAMAHERAAGVADDLRQRFTEQYAEWQRYRTSPQVRVCANPARHCQAAAFDEIVRLGPDAVPLLMDCMAQGDFFCLRAVEAIHRTHPGHAGLAPVVLLPEERVNSEQGKAALALSRWLQA